MRRKLRLTQAEAAQALGIHRTYLVLIEAGKKTPSMRLMRFIDEFIDRASKQPAGKPGALALQRTAPVFSVPGTPLGRPVPVVSWATAGHAKDYQDLAAQIDETVMTECRDANAFAIIIEGDSMESKFFAGDRVVFNPNLEPRTGDAVLAKLNDGRSFFKWYFRTGPDGRRVKLVSENANYTPLEFDQSELRFIYPAWDMTRRVRK